MKALVAINRVCYGSCLLSIIAGAFVTVWAIWTEQEDVGWKGVSTAAVLVFASILVLATNAIIGTKVMNERGGLGDFLPGHGRGGPRPRTAPPAPDGSRES